MRFLRHLHRDAPEAFRVLHEVHGPTVAAQLPRLSLLSITDPRDVDHVLQKNWKNYGKGDQGADLAPLWGRSNLLMSDGSSWLRQRRICGPAFHSDQSAVCHETVLRHVEPFLSELQASAEHGHTRSLYYDMRRIVLQILCDLWLGVDAGSEVDRLGDLLRRATDIASSRILVLLKLPLSLPRPAHIRYRRLAREIHRRIDHLIEQAQERGKRGDTLLGHMLRSGNSNAPYGMPRQEVCNNIVMLLLAAYEFPSLGWTLYFVGRHQRAMDRVRAEIDEVLGRRDPSLQDLVRLRYLRHCIDEALRLRPPSPILGRMTLADDDLVTCSVRARTMVAIPVYVLHRNPAAWPHPLEYRPERFAGDIPWNMFLPFGGGPRACIGETIARHLQMTFLAKFFQCFRYTLVPDYEPQPNDKLKPHPSLGVPVLLHRC